jgi:hypothetical protein
MHKKPQIFFIHGFTLDFQHTFNVTYLVCMSFSCIYCAHKLTKFTKILKKNTHILSRDENSGTSMDMIFYS